VPLLRLDIVVARAANHEGPARDDRFAVGSWTRQIARLEAEGGGTLRVGDLSAERDIPDVRDVCRAYGAPARALGSCGHLQRRLGEVREDG
jgi:GDP-D-mannose dehydratase